MPFIESEYIRPMAKWYVILPGTWVSVSRDGSDFTPQTTRTACQRCLVRAQKRQLLCCAGAVEIAQSQRRFCNPMHELQFTEKR